MNKREIKLAVKNGITEEVKKRLIIEMVRERYDSNDEIAVLRQRDSKPEEYEEYNAYVEACKESVKAALSEVER